MFLIIEKVRFWTTLPGRITRWETWAVLNQSWAVSRINYIAEPRAEDMNLWSTGPCWYSSWNKVSHSYNLKMELVPCCWEYRETNLTGMYYYLQHPCFCMFLAKEGRGTSGMVETLPCPRGTDAYGIKMAEGSSFYTFPATPVLNCRRLSFKVSWCYVSDSCVTFILLPGPDAANHRHKWAPSLCCPLAMMGHCQKTCLLCASHSSVISSEPTPQAIMLRSSLRTDFNTIQELIFPQIQQFKEAQEFSQPSNSAEPSTYIA